MNASKITSRFRRGSGGSAAPRSAAAEAPAPDVKTTEPSATEAKPELSADAATPKAEPAPAEPASAPVAGTATGGPDGETTPPKASRLVEGERLRPTRTIAEAASAAWPAVAVARLKPVARPAALAAALALTLGVGVWVGTHGHSGSQAASAEMRGLEGEVVRLAAELRGMKSAVDGLKGERDKTRGEILTRQAQLTEKVDRLIAQDVAGRLAKLGEQVERTGRELGRVATLTERVERLEKPAAPVPVASAPTPPAKPVASAAAPNLDVKETGSIGEAKPAPDPRKTQIEGYFVRDFEEGFALIETRAGRYVEVAVGYVVPGIGRVEAIERRGRQWVVVTPKGYIGER